MGQAGDVVDERLWNEEDRPEEGQKPGDEKFEKDAPIQVLTSNLTPTLCMNMWWAWSSCFAKSLALLTDWGANGNCSRSYSSLWMFLEA